MAAAAVVQSPSPFASLLRRSKFAAFDPAICQVYTTYEGNAHRGHWGLKRPLPLRRRKAFITVKSVDSRQQQTEWNHGESQARFIRRWDELGVNARVVASSPWEKKIGHEACAVWMVDSEFAPAVDWQPMSEAEQNIGGPERANTVPNVDAMSNKEFERYLKKLRKQRPEFLAYIQDLAENNPHAKLEDKSMFELAYSGKEYHKKFIASKLANTLNSMESRNIEQKPHRTGGLSYSHTSLLQTFFTTAYQPGIVLQRNYQSNDRGRLSRAEMSFIASFAGLTSVLRMRNTSGTTTALLDIISEEGIKRENVENSITNFRLYRQPRLAMSPLVVGQKRQGLKAARIESEVVSDMKSDFQRDNPHLPGSREYIGLEAGLASSTRILPMNFPVPVKRKKFVRTTTGQNLVQTLKAMVLPETTGR